MASEYERSGIDALTSVFINNSFVQKMVLRLKMSLMESFDEFVIFITYLLSVDSTHLVSDGASRLRFIPGSYSYNFNDLPTYFSRGAKTGLFISPAWSGKCLCIMC